MSGFVIERHPSPNFDNRACTISHIILHYTDMADCDLALARLCDAEAKVSAHYLIRRDGHIFHLVDEAARAWHAGVSCWRGEADMNSASIGIELDHNGHKDGKMDAFLEAQISALIWLLQEVTARHAIAPQNILGHSDIAPGRKIDPGEAFDWAALHKAGFGLWVDNVKTEDVLPLATGSEDKAVVPLQKALAAIGYQITVDGSYGPQTRAVISAFQRHFRPAKIDGIADAETQTLVYALCRLV
ncbi:MAG: N-acetylmuramoyl-L-alanine amidase [Rhodobiaceae bacterium]|nr:N-acetylmuramoyl-L-alanine amidase [Rhodobiaceae bacterium]